MHNNGIVHGSTKTGLLFKVCNWSIWWQGVILSDDTAKSIACSIVMSLRDSSPKYSILSTALFQTRNRSCKSVMDAFVRDRKLCQKHLARAVQLRTGVTKVLTLYDFWCVYDIQIYLFICKCSAMYTSNKCDRPCQGHVRNLHTLIGRRCTTPMTERTETSWLHNWQTPPEYTAQLNTRSYHWLIQHVHIYIVCIVRVIVSYWWKWQNRHVCTVYSIIIIIIIIIINQRFIVRLLLGKIRT